MTTRDTTDGKVNFVAAVSDDLVARGLKAGDWIRQATGGGGGGRPQLAQAGGKDPAKLPDALRVATEYAGRNPCERSDPNTRQIFNLEPR